MMNGVKGDIEINKESPYIHIYLNDTIMIPFVSPFKIKKVRHVPNL